ncbi:MAG TPA: DUF937 domain-containing protein [Gemmatimonadaceae bacterium]|nr:DUF937 domain-containing protein [Gemmatimonadaceae bacterium]
MTSLVDSLYSVATPELAGNIASRLGEPTQNVSRGLQGAMAGLLLGLVRKSGDSSAMQGIYDTVNTSVNDGRVLDNPSELLTATDTGSPITSLGSQFISNVFGNRASAVNDVIARNSGLRASVIGNLMQFAAPLVLAVLGRRVREGSLNPESFTRLIAGERASIERAAPAGLASALGAEERPYTREREYEVRRDATTADQPPREYGVEPEKKNRWFWPTVATVGALALLWAIWPRSREHRVNPADTMRSTYSGGEVANPYAVTPPPGTTAAARVTLPDGSVLNVAEVGPEGRLVGFLKDPNKPVDQTTWFVLDRMHFESNSAKLSPDSDAEIKDVVAILKAYPNATVKIGGFTDNKGSESANKRLSRDRARSVEKALEKEGIASNRVSAEGYGSAHPIADNSTEAGRAQNRRIGILVTHK